MDEKVLVIVPAYNEEKNIGIVTSDIKKSVPDCDILVVNDCSSDATGEIARSIEGVKVVNLPHNMGIGGAVQTGFMYAHRNDYDYVVQVDGDGQHIAQEVDRLIDTIKSQNMDVVIGSRFLGVESYRSSCYRRVGIRLFYWIYKVLLGIKVTDGTSGFRIYNKRSIEFLSKNYPEDYPEPEAVVVLKKNGFAIGEVGVNMRERIHGKSSITPFKSIHYMIKVLLSIFFAYIRN